MKKAIRKFIWDGIKTAIILLITLASFYAMGWRVVVVWATPTPYP